MNTESDAIALHDGDTVATALRPLARGETARVATPAGTVEIAIAEDIRRCHKFALDAIRAGEPIRKYGEIIGDATQAIAAGAHVHVHNLVGRVGKRREGEA